MEGNNHLDALLIAYLLNDLDAEEESLVLEYIEASEENRLYFEKLKCTWRVTGVGKELMGVDVNLEWNKLEKFIIPDQPASLKGGEGFEDTHGPVRKKEQRFSIYRLLALGGVAAAVLVVIGLGLASLYPAKHEAGAREKVSRSTPTPAARTRHEVNHSGNTRQLRLQDGSEIWLSDNSDITFREPFDAGRRDVTISGKAYFTVASDKDRPFTVFSGDISTTVLGTKFTVSAFENEHNIKIRLYEGRIVVKSVENAVKKLSRDYVLSPGQELIYDRNRMVASVQNFRNDAPLARVPGNKNEAEDPSFPVHSRGSWYMFNNQSLGEIFDQLQDMYKVRIVYSKEQIDRKYFIGTFSRSDSLGMVLKQITVINNLKLSKKDNTYYVSR